MEITDVPFLVTCYLVCLATFLQSPIPFSVGHDLNRRWLKTDPVLHPEIVAFKVPPSFARFFNTAVTTLICSFLYVDKISCLLSFF